MRELHLFENLRNHSTVVEFCTMRAYKLLENHLCRQQKV